MQMILKCYLVAWYESLPNPAPPLWWCDLIFSAGRQTASLPLIHLAGGEFRLRQGSQPIDLWVESLAVLDKLSVRANEWGAWKTETIKGLRLADMAAGFCKLSYSQAWMGKEAKTGMNLLILLLLWEWHTQAIFTRRGTHCWWKQSVCDVVKLLNCRWTKWVGRAGRGDAKKVWHDAF